MCRNYCHSIVVGVGVVAAILANTASCFSIVPSSPTAVASMELLKGGGYNSRDRRSGGIGVFRRTLPAAAAVGGDRSRGGSNNFPSAITRTRRRNDASSAAVTTTTTTTALRASPIAYYAIPTAATATTTTAMSMSMSSTTDIVRTFLGIMLARTISNSGLKKRSLNRSGALSAFVVASLSLATSWRNGITLLAFYWTSSKLTRVGSKIKGKLEEGATEGGERGAGQVFACSLIAVVCACVRRAVVGADGPLQQLPMGGSSAVAAAAAAMSLNSPLALLGDRLTLAYVAFFACCAGDTWASELGILSKSLPRLVIKPWKKVPPGTNGGVSLVGLGASAAGGTLMGLLHGIFVPGGIASLFPASSWPSSPLLSSAISPAQFGREVLVLTFVGFMGGLGGSLLDSLLGATIQATYYDEEAKKIAKRSGPTTRKVGGWGFLSNEMVNVVSTAMSALVAALACQPLLKWI